MRRLLPGPGQSQTNTTIYTSGSQTNRFSLYTLFKPTSSQRKELVWKDQQEVRFILEKVQRSLHPVALGSHFSGKVSSQLPLLHLLPAVLPSYPRTGGGGRARTTCVHQLRVTPSCRRQGVWQLLFISGPGSPESRAFKPSAFSLTGGNARRCGKEVWVLRQKPAKESKYL